MKKLALALMFCGASVFAATVDYSTTGTFGSDSSNVVSLNGATITFTGESATSVNAGGSFAQVGTFVVAGGASLATFSDSFTLNILQTSPAGTGSTTTAITGSIISNGSTIAVSFVPSSLNIAGAQWTFYNTPIAAPTNVSGVLTPGTTTLTEFVAAPEPASLGLIGAGLAGLGLAFRRRAAK